MVAWPGDEVGRVERSGGEGMSWLTGTSQRMMAEPDLIHLERRSIGTGLCCIYVQSIAPQ